jgi:hypothetical protein
LPHYTVLTDWSARDRSLILTERTAEGDWDLIARSIDAPARPEILAGGPGIQANGRLSPDGRLIAYISGEPADAAIVVQRYPDGARCTVARGTQAVWGPAHGEVFVLSASGTMMRVAVDPTAQAPCAISPAVRLFDTHVRDPSTARSSFDVSSRTGLFLINDAQVQDRAWLTVTTNWVAATQR